MPIQVHQRLSSGRPTQGELWLEPQRADHFCILAAANLFLPLSLLLPLLLSASLFQRRATQRRGDGRPDLVVRKWYFPRVIFLNILTTHAALDVSLAATPAPLPTPSSCLAAHPLVLYLGAWGSGFPVTGGVYLSQCQCRIRIRDLLICYCIQAFCCLLA